MLKYKENINKQNINNNNNIKELISIIKELNNNFKSELIKLTSKLIIIIFILAIITISCILIITMNLVQGYL
jgi:hypothetical protein